MQNRITFLFAALALSAHLSSNPTGQELTPPEVTPVLLEDFEADTLGERPRRWSSGTKEIQGVVVEHDDERGKCVHYDLGKEGFGYLASSMKIGVLQGSQVRFSARVRVENAGQAQLFVRFDYEDGSSVMADDMSDRPIMTNKWADYEIVVNSADKPGRMVFGVMGYEGVKIMLDDLRIENFGNLAPQATEKPRKLANRGLQNVKAFARLVGYVRYFHPSDAAKGLDWERFTIEGVRRVEGVQSAQALADVLLEIFQPVAPTIQIFTGNEAPAIPEALKRPSDLKKLYMFAWLHHGVGINHGVYSSARQRRRVKGDTLPKGMSDPAAVFEQVLPGEVTCRIPLALWGDRKGTFPKAPAGTLEASHGESGSGKLREIWTPEDRGTRLGGVILAWNVFQHFYPYFDEVEVDWEAQLDIGLQRAAVDEDGDGFTGTLERMIVSLQDGHGSVQYRKQASKGSLPFHLTWASGELVVTAVHPNPQYKMAVGDLVVRVNGQSALDYLESLEERISGASLQAKRALSVQHAVYGPLGESVSVEWKHKEVLSKFDFEYSAEVVAPPAHTLEMVQEVEPGIWYLDLDRVTTEGFISRLDELTQAKGIVFDLRGYPNDFAAFEFFPHIIDEPVKSAWWKVPVIRRPDRDAWSWNDSQWTIQPAKPLIQAKLAFLTGAAAISYAETCMGIVEHYELAAIVGSSTAGTNGNINPFPLPGGYVISWTGMKVRKNDNSPHHGVGIQPTIPIEPTRAGIREGRDEVLEAGLRAVGGK